MSSYELILGAVHLIVGMLNLFLGLVIFREAPRQRLHQMAGLLLFSAALGAILGSSSFLFVLLRSTAGAVRTDFVRSFAYLWEFFFPALLLLSALFPREMPILRRRPGIEVLIFLPHGFHFLLVLGASYLGADLGLDALESPAGFLAPFVSILQVFLSLLVKSHQMLFSLVNLAYIALSMALILRALRGTANPTVRRQLQTIFGGLGTCVVLYSAAYPIPDLIGFGLPVLVSSSMLVAALAVGTGAIALAIVRYNFLDLHRLVRRSILYATTTAIIVGLYLALVRYLGHAALRSAGLETEILDPVFLVLALLLFQPLLERMESFLEALLVGAGTDPRQIVARVSQILASSSDPQSMAGGVLEVLVEGLELNGAAFLRTREGDPPFAILAARNMPPATLQALCRALPRDAERWQEDRPLTRRDLENGGGEAGDQTGPTLMFPVQTADDLLGVLVLGRAATRRRLKREEIVLLRTLSGYISLTLRNLELLRASVEKALLEEQLSLARRIQQSILPGRFPATDDLEVWGLQIPSLQVGGDYFDVVPLEGDRYAVAIADVAGKGVPAALLMSMVAAGLRTLVQSRIDVASTLVGLNQLLCQATSPEQFVTFFLGIVDVRAMRLDYGNAGHNYPLYIPESGRPGFLEESGLVLGVSPRAAYAAGEMPLQRGDGLLLYTDGVTEARAPSGEMFGEERLLGLLDGQLECRQAREAVETIRDRVLSFSGRESLADDLTLLFLRCGGRNAGRRAPSAPRVDVSGRAQAS
ncbi:MAG: SpoIIE family protein phosphatase [Candidatus Eisenbacteria bacterium]|nr:SpoIIE family protein phosphatase [Candidatus Eisenbacteria bacterium]